MSRDRNDLAPLEAAISRLFGLGIVVSATLLGVGLALSLLHRDAARWTLTAGIVVLMSIPAVRVVISCLDALRRRDVALGGATVLVTLALLWLFKH